MDKNSLDKKKNNGSVKRIKRLHDSESRTRKLNKSNRMAGLEYVGFSTKNGKVKQDRNRSARKIGSTCSSKFCEKSKLRHCQKFEESTRQKIFKSFWSLPKWPSKRLFVQGLVKSGNVERSRTPRSKKKKSFKFFLYLNGSALQVCRRMFLSTLGLKESMVKSWVQKTPQAIDQSKPQIKEVSNRRQNILQVARKIRLSLYFIDLDKMESHYCRRDSSKEYIAATFRSKAELFEAYKKFIADNGYGQSVSYFTFSQVFDSRNLALFTPRKDQCDLCVGHKAGQITLQRYNLHIERKNRANQEKAFDKQAAIEGRRHVFTMDKQAVKLAPDFNASAIYFKTRLQVHNFTMYNLATHHCKNYWWDETEGDLSASSFASCVIHHLTVHCSSDTLPIVLFSDGCGGQNRNYFLSNALANFAVKNNKIVEQKWLEKGHTQMECDSAHAKIEKKLKNTSIFVPEDYIDVTKNVRKTIAINQIRQNCPFEAECLDHNFFLDFANKDQLRFKSIRPGNKPRDPTVTNLRSMIYLPSGGIKYKIDFDDEYEDLPRKIIPFDSGRHQPLKLHKERLKIKASKFDHLQQLKKVIDKKYHSFYDNLPH